MSKEFLIKANKHFKNSATVKESSFENEFCDYAKSKGCIPYKLIILNRKGFPDRTILCPGGIVFFIEFKRVGKKPSVIQSKIQNLLEDLGFKYYICDSLEKAKRILDNIL